MESQLIFLIITVLTITDLAIIFYFWRSEQSRQDNSEENRARALEIINKAYHQAQGIIGQAELEGVKLAAKSKIETKKMTEAYEEEIDTDRDKLEKAFLVEADKAYEQFANYLSKLTDYTGKSAADSLAKFQKATREQVKDELLAYQKEKMAEFEANLPALLEKTLTLVLPKTIKLQDQMNLINDALEKAKADKLIN